MFNIDISDSSIEVLNLKKSLMGKTKVSSSGRVELEQGVVKSGEILDTEKLTKKISELVKKGKINFTLPDLRTFTCRVQLASDIAHSALEPFLKEKILEIVPYDFEELIYDFKVVNETEKGKEILFLAVPTKILAGYLKIFKALKLTPIFAVSESLAAFEIFRETVVKDEVLLYIDIGSQTSTFSFFDRFGPFLTLNEPVETKLLKEEVKKAVSFLKEKHEKEVKRIILGGGGSLEIDGEAFSKEIEVWTTKIDKILEDKLKKASLHFNVGDLPPTLFINVLGLSLLSQKKEALNLLKKSKDLLIKLEEQNDQEKKEEEKKDEIKESKEEEETIKEGKEVKQGEEEKPEEIKEQEKPEKKSVFSRFLGGLLRLKWLLVIIIVSLLTFSGIYFFVKKPSVKETEEQADTTSPTVQPATEEDEPTPTTEIARKDFKIKILNGSGIAGKAGEVAEILEGLGYEIVETGNADSFDYEETVIQVKEEKEGLFSDLTNDLKDDYTVSSEKNLLPEEEGVDAVVIVGKE
ncbi:pilus assembly protein PilM [Candidatus Microgenomates bacterium]|nr:pilus assembly protein PilM [Candidatus Microgenomates bacterium]